MSRTVQIVIDCADPDAVARFWAQALGYVRQPPPEGFASWQDALAAWGVPQDQWNSRSALIDPDGDGPRVFLQQVPEEKAGKNRLHLDLRVSDPSAEPDERDAVLMAEVERLEGLGGRRLEWRFEQGKHFMVMQDVEGNEFCLT